MSFLKAVNCSSKAVEMIVEGPGQWGAGDTSEHSVRALLLLTVATAQCACMHGCAPYETHSIENVRTRKP